MVQSASNVRFGGKADIDQHGDDVAFREYGDGRGTLRRQHNGPKRPREISHRGID